MISEISTNSLLIQNNSSIPKKQSLNEEQKDYVKSVLDEFDASSLSDEDALEIISNFSQAGITPSRDLANSLSDAGFLQDEIGQLASALGSSQNSPKIRESSNAPIQDNQEEENEIFDSLKNLLDVSENTNNDEDIKLQEKITENSNTSFDDALDLSSKIVNLNDASKNKVSELFEKYNQNENNLSKENVQKVVQGSLNQILNDSNNYKQTSFYA